MNPTYRYWVDIKDNYADLHRGKNGLWELHIGPGTNETFISRSAAIAFLYTKAPKLSGPFRN